MVRAERMTLEAALRAARENPEGTRSVRWRDCGNIAGHAGILQSCGGHF